MLQKRLGVAGMRVAGNLKLLRRKIKGRKILIIEEASSRFLNPGTSGIQSVRAVIAGAFYMRLTTLSTTPSNINLEDSPSYEETDQ
jgi:hypothetical protein